VRLIEYLAHSDKAKIWGVLRVFGDCQPGGDEQLREVHLDSGFDSRGVRLDHPLAFDGHREWARKIRRGDHALGTDQWQILRCATRVGRAGGTFITANAIDLFTRRRCCGHTEHCHCDE